MSMLGPLATRVCHDAPQYDDEFAKPAGFIH